MITYISQLDARFRAYLERGNVSALFFLFVFAEKHKHLFPLALLPSVLWAFALEIDQASFTSAIGVVSATSRRFLGDSTFWWGHASPPLLLRLTTEEKRRVEGCILRE